MPLPEQDMAILMRIFQSNECDETVRAWITAITISLRTAEKMGYEDDTFHKHPYPAWKKETLLEVLYTDWLPDIKGSVTDNKVIWGRGFYYNSALMRIAFLTERGLKILWERINKCNGLYYPYVWNWVIQDWNDFDYGKLRWWYIDVFLNRNENDFKILDRVRKQVNVFKHEPTITPLEKLYTIEDAYLAFSRLLQLLNKTVEDETTLKEQQSKSEWLKKVEKTLS